MIQLSLCIKQVGRNEGGEAERGRCGEEVKLRFDNLKVRKI